MAQKTDKAAHLEKGVCCEITGKQNHSGFLHLSLISKMHPET